jgi:hypothetical protein
VIKRHEPHALLLGAMLSAAAAPPATATPWSAVCVGDFGGTPYYRSTSNIRSPSGVSGSFFAM